MELLRGTACPYCETTDIEIDNESYTEDVILRDGHCNGCGQYFTFQYELMVIFNADGRMIAENKI